MRIVIDDTLAKRTSLVDAANSLLFLRNAMESLDRSWSDRFTSHIATLESAGTATAEQRNTMGTSFHELVENTLKELGEMVSSLDLGEIDDE
jgi:hypothetical protein